MYHDGEGSEGVLNLWSVSAGEVLRSSLSAERLASPQEGLQGEEETLSYQLPRGAAGQMKKMVR